MGSSSQLIADSAFCPSEVSKLSTQLIEAMCSLHTVIKLSKESALNAAGKYISNTLLIFLPLLFCPGSEYLMLWVGGRELILLFESDNIN